jgi:hypothetical protein
MADQTEASVLNKRIKAGNRKGGPLGAIPEQNKAIAAFIQRFAIHEQQVLEIALFASYSPSSTPTQTRVGNSISL